MKTFLSPLASRLSFLVIFLLPLLVSAQTITGYESDDGIWFEKYDFATDPFVYTLDNHLFTPQQKFTYSYRYTKEGKEYFFQSTGERNWKLNIGPQWGDPRWKEWEGSIENKYKYCITETHGLHTGDLIFVRDTAGMGAAVMESTGNFSHVAIVVCPRYEEMTMVYEAVPDKGVTRTELSVWLEAQGASTAMLGSPAQNRLVCRRLTTEFDTTQLLFRLNHALGAPYDPYFAANNGLYYCSELVENCFVRPNGRRIFETKPMNFRATDGTMPEFWVNWFAKLGCPIPEGQPGTNPTDLFYSPMLVSPKPGW